MKLALALPFIVAGEVLAEVTRVCDDIAAYLTDVRFPTLPQEV